MAGTVALVMWSPHWPAVRQLVTAPCLPASRRGAEESPRGRDTPRAALSTPAPAQVVAPPGSQRTPPTPAGSPAVLGKRRPEDEDPPGPSRLAPGTQPGPGRPCSTTKGRHTLGPSARQ